MDAIRERWHRWRSGVALVPLVILLLGGPQLAAAQAPTAPAVTAGNYTVSYTACSSCTSAWLEERSEGGSWVYVGTGTLTVTNKPVGTYYYRAGYFYMFDAYYYTSMSYSAETRVTVTTNMPVVDSLETQLGYRYETRYGDGNGDGRLDLFLNRTAGGTAGNGALDAVLLLQDASARFTAAVPSAAQVATARAWPTAAVQVVLRDFNVDGFADVLLKGIAGALGVGGALNQIVYAPGRVLTSLPLGVRGVDASLKNFAANTRDYLVDSSYFRRSAPVAQVFLQVPYYACVPNYSLDYGDQYCSWFTYYVALTLPDYSVFESNALAAWTQETAIQENRTSRAQGVENIRRSFESALGAPIGGRNLDGINVEQGSPDTAARRGLELFLAVFGIFEANAQELDPPREVGRNPNTVYITGRRILGFLPFHTALEFAGQTISAYDNNSSFLDDGTLVSQVNWPSDNPALMLALGTVSSTLGAPLYWTRLIAADARYRDNLDYDAIPSIGSAGYNSNGYVHGIIRATSGVPSIDLNRYVGGEKPVPPQAFN